MINKICPIISKGTEVRTWYSGETFEMTGQVECLKEKCMAWEPENTTEGGYCKLIEKSNR